MRLKPQNSAKQVLEADISELRSVRDALSAEVTSLIHGLNETEARVKSEGERLMASLQEKESAHASRISEMLSEVKTLEARKVEAMKPIDDKRKAVIEREDAAAAREKSCEEKERQLVIDRSAVAALFEEAADRLALAKESEERAVRADERLKEATSFHDKSMAALNAGWNSLRAAEAEWKKKVTEKESELSIREESVESGRKWNAEERNRMASDKLAMQSERAAVSAAFKELRKKTDKKPL